jgi:S1-C subfamily serine protease
VYIKAAERLAGHEARCPKCRTKLRIPDYEPAYDAVLCRPAPPPLLASSTVRRRPKPPTFWEFLKTRSVASWFRLGTILAMILVLGTGSIVLSLVNSGQDPASNLVAAKSSSRTSAKLLAASENTIIAPVARFAPLRDSHGSPAASWAGSAAAVKLGSGGDGRVDAASKDKSSTERPTDFQPVKADNNRASSDKPKPDNRSGPSFDDWLQDFEAAKSKATKEKKDILIFFHASDWCPWSQKMANEVFLTPEFRNGVAQQYVLVLADFPKSEAAKKKVQCPDRNENLARQFGVTGFPNAFLSDGRGCPYGWLQVVEGGPTVCLGKIAEWRLERDARDRLFRQIETAEGAKQAEALQEGLKFIVEMHPRLMPCYGPTLEDWLKIVDRLDGNNAQGLNEAAFFVWWRIQSSRLRDSADPEVKRMLDRLREWSSVRRFRDPNIAASLHLQAAQLLSAVGNKSAAASSIEKAAAFHPTDANVQLALLRAKAGLTGIVAGTGFLITSQGHVLTNNHVIQGKAKVLIQLPGQRDAVPVEIVAADAQSDIALLKLDPTQVTKIRPLRISTSIVTRGTEVAAFGYPLGGLVGYGVKLTTGVVSNLPEPETGGMLVLDCRVNPGNSGGPLCNAQGMVVGMVTAKSPGGGRVDSYGMAIPADTLRQFLSEHVVLSPTVGRSTTSKMGGQRWAEIDHIVSPAVLPVVRKIE